VCFGIKTLPFGSAALPFGIKTLPFGSVALPIHMLA
jgi:hypothetical protein